MTVYGTTKMKKITDGLTLIHFLDVGVNLEGFWNYDQMALQVEDIYDVLASKFPHSNFLLLLDQSSGHGKMREGSLNVNSMRVRCGGCQENLRETKIKEVGPYPSIFQIRDVQRMIYDEQDLRPFYLSDNHRKMRKYDRPTGKWKVITKTKKN